METGSLLPNSRTKNKNKKVHRYFVLNSRIRIKTSDSGDGGEKKVTVRKWEEELFLHAAVFPKKNDEKTTTTNFVF